MENIENIKNNLSNVCYLYALLRFDDMDDFLTVEYVDDVEPEELLDKLNDYFIIQSWDTPDIWKKFDIVGKDKLKKSKQAINRITEITINPDENLASFKYHFLSSSERANEAMLLLEDGNIYEFRNLYPEFSERKLYEETDSIMLLIHHIDGLVTIKDE